MPRPKPIIVSSQPLSMEQNATTVDLGPILELFKKKKEADAQAQNDAERLARFTEIKGAEQTVPGLQMGAQELFPEPATQPSQFNLEALGGLSQPQPQQGAGLDLNALTRAMGGIQEQAPTEQPFRLENLLPTQTPEVDIPQLDFKTLTDVQKAGAQDLIGAKNKPSEAALAGIASEALSPTPEKQPDIFAKASVKDFTRESVKAAEKSGNRSDLVLRPEDLKNKMIKLKRGGKSRFEMEDIIRKQFVSNSEDYRAVRDSFARISASAEEPSAAGDLSLIFNYMKMLDPQSVVRESEFATAESARGMPEGIKNVWAKIMEGKKLSEVQRKDFTNRAEQLIGRQEAQHERRIDTYGGIVKDFELNRDNVLLDLSDPIFEQEKIDKRIAELEQKGAQ